LLAAARRQAMLVEVRAELLVAIEEANAQAQQRRVDSMSPSCNAMPRTFLRELANRGPLNALAELRRLAKPKFERSQTITGCASWPALPLPRCRVNHLGRVTYFASDKAVVTDSLKGVSVVVPGETSYALAQKVAVARYGTHLTLSGDAAFLRGMFAAARACGHELTVRDEGCGAALRAGAAFRQRRPPKSRVDSTLRRLLARPPCPSLLSPPLFRCSVPLSNWNALI
jgi:hypothetical protein